MCDKPNVCGFRNFFTQPTTSTWHLTRLLTTPHPPPFKKKLHLCTCERKQFLFKILVPPCCCVRHYSVNRRSSFTSSLIFIIFCQLFSRKQLLCFSLVFMYKGALLVRGKNKPLCHHFGSYTINVCIVHLLYLYVCLVTLCWFELSWQWWLKCVKQARLSESASQSLHWMIFFLYIIWKRTK